MISGKRKKMLRNQYKYKFNSNKYEHYLVKYYYRYYYNLKYMALQLSQRELMIKCFDLDYLNCFPHRAVRRHLSGNFQSLGYALDQRFVKEEGTFVSVYRSMAKFDGSGFPVILDGSSDRLQKIKEFNEKVLYKMLAYDLLVDIDCPKIKSIGDDSGLKIIDWSYMEDVKQCTFNLCKMLDAMKVEYYYPVFTGAGFQLIIPHSAFNSLDYPIIKEFSKRKDKKDIFDLYHDIVQYIHDFICCYVDASVIDPRRVGKCAYSLAFHAPNIISICFPFYSLESFRDFDYRKARLTQDYNDYLYQKKPDLGFMNINQFDKKNEGGKWQLDSENLRQMTKIFGSVSSQD